MVGSLPGTTTSTVTTMSPTPSTRPFNYQAANYTVVAISQYQFQERPSFVWRYLENIDTVVTSIPLDPLALLPVHDQVCSCPLYFSFLFRFFWLFSFLVSLGTQRCFICVQCWQCGC